MLWTIQELRKLSRTLHQFQGVCDCQKFITEDETDVLKITDVFVKGNFRLIEANNIYLFDCNITCNVTMACAVSLKEVVIPLNFDTTLEFSQTFIDDNTHVIEGITIDLEPVIFSEIMIEKPMRVVHPDAYKDYHEEEVHLDEDESKNPFAALKNKIY